LRKFRTTAATATGTTATAPDDNFTEICQLSYQISRTNFIITNVVIENTTADFALHYRIRILLIYVIISLINSDVTRVWQGFPSKSQISLFFAQIFAVDRQMAFIISRNYAKLSISFHPIIGVYYLNEVTVFIST